MKTRNLPSVCGKAVGLMLSLSACTFYPYSYSHSDSQIVSPVIRNDRPDTELTAPFPRDYRSPPSPPPPGAEIRKYAVDQPGPAPYNFGVKPMEDDTIFAMLMVDRLEYRSDKSADQILWDLAGWAGNDYDKIYVESEGVSTFDGSAEDTDLQILYARSIAPYWDVQIGPRYTFGPEDRRFFGVLGLEGIAPQWFEIEANLYVSEDADVTADADAEYDMLLTQRLILQPRVQIKAVAQADDAHNEGDGLNELGLGFRLRYEFSRKFAPYIGLSWERRVGETAHLAEKEGEDASRLLWLSGVRFWF